MAAVRPLHSKQHFGAILQRGITLVDILSIGIALKPFSRFDSAANERVRQSTLMSVNSQASRWVWEIT